MTTDLSLLDDDSEIGLAQQEGLALIAEAEALRITDQASFQAAGVFRKRIKAHIEMVKGFWGPKKARSRSVWQADVDDEKRMLEGPEAVLKIINDGMTAHERAMARERRMRRRSRSLMPPQMPNFSPFWSAYSRQSSRTTQPRQTSLASLVDAPRSGKNRSGSTPRQLAYSCQTRASDWPPMSTGTLICQDLSFVQLAGPAGVSPSTAPIPDV